MVSDTASSPDSGGPFVLFSVLEDVSLEVSSELANISVVVVSVTVVASVTIVGEVSYPRLKHFLASTRLSMQKESPSMLGFAKFIQNVQ